MGDFIISADLGQINDFTAFTIFECVGSGNGTEYHLRHIERPERGTSYPHIVDRLKELATSEQLKGKFKTVCIDITGGRPFWDMMKQARISSNLIGISITGGNVVTWDSKNSNTCNVPKRDLISSLQVAFQNGQLQIADGLPLASMLVQELTNFKVKINSKGNDQYGAASDWREGIHDDIVLSAAMGVWVASQHYLSRNWLKNLI